MRSPEVRPGGHSMERRRGCIPDPGTEPPISHLGNAHSSFCPSRLCSKTAQEASPQAGWAPGASDKPL